MTSVVLAIKAIQDFDDGEHGTATSGRLTLAFAIRAIAGRNPGILQERVFNARAARAA
ncbi:MAG TPA: hypothetical protein VK110_02985 [Salinisphaeraceae bacterium]|nr:hypothetical protein [Salinisphaeraceae bacterium]